MTPHDPDRDPIDLVAEEFADRCRRGESPAVTDYVARHPELADDLRDLLPAVAQMERLKLLRRTTPAGPPVDSTPLTRLGDYRIVREIGRGGMGIVYEAVQESLGRRVALKILPADARADATKRERFLREAQAAARLHHTNIVPVFGVGEENGVPYYVMQYIPGCGLYHLIAGWRGEPGAGAAKTVRTPRRSTRAVRDDDTAPDPLTWPLPRPGEWRAIARVALATARALQEAHAQGILHRDVKPGNLLIDPRGHVWVTDFGLAKLADKDTLTATGDVMGTLQYMAPEALHGQIDERTDVYGLGMTLYELVTLRLPFDESNPAILIKEIGEKDPTPPRRVNPAVPRDLETIVLTAIAREPRRRYPSADALADDLDAFLHDRPIRARRASLPDRGWRWCRRNPVVAGLSAVTAAVLVSAAVFGWVMYGRAKDALVKESSLRGDAEAANRKLSENLDRSLATFAKVFDAAAKAELPPPKGPAGRPGGPPGGPPPRRPDPGHLAAVLEPILAFYDKIEEEGAAGPRLRLDAVRAYRRVGEIRDRPEGAEKADAAFRRARTMIDDLYREFPDDGSDPELAAGVKRELVAVYARLPSPKPSDPGFRDELAKLRVVAAAGERLRQAGDLDLELRGPLSDLYQKLGDMLERAGRRAEADEAFRVADELRPPARPQPPYGAGPPHDRPPPPGHRPPPPPPWER